MELAKKTRRKVLEYIKDNDMLRMHDTVVAGVSGGADSMCLLHILMKIKEIYKIDIEAVHIHHGIRGEEADEDMEYVQKMCNEWGIRFHAFKYDIINMAKEMHLSTEEAGRIKRYETFREVLKEALKIKPEGRGKIAVAHNMDDNSETFLLNLFRGSGLNGLVGISPVRDEIIRPVMCLSRQEIEDYLKEENINYRTDSTNLEDIYTRNKIRLSVLPFIEENINSKVKAGINRTTKLLTEVNDFMNKSAKDAYMKYTRKEDVNVYIELELFLNEENIISRMVVREAINAISQKLKDITFSHVDSVAALAKNHVSKKVNLPYGICAERLYDGIKLYVAKEKEYTEFLLKEIDIDRMMNKEIEISESEYIKFEECENIQDVERMPETLYTKLMNYDILKGNVSIRNRRPKDYMIIDGKGRKKKLKDMLIDMKIPKEERDKLVLLTKDSEVLWIIGYRMSESCKINADTKKTIKVKYKEMEKSK